MSQPRLAGGARPRGELAAAGLTRTRVALATPDGVVVSSVWAVVSGDQVTLAVAVPGVAVGWSVSGRGIEGDVTAVDGRTLTTKVSP